MADGFLSGVLQGFGSATGDLTDTLFKLEQMKRMDAANKSLTDYRLAHTKKLLEDQEKEQKMTGILSSIPTTKTTQAPAPPPSDIANENYVPSGYTQSQEVPLSAGELNKARAQALIQGGFPTQGIAFEKEGRAADQETFKTTMDWYKERLKNEEPQSVIAEMAKNPIIVDRIPNIGSVNIDRQNKIASIPVTLTEPKTVTMNGQEYTLPVGEYTYSRTPQGEKYVPSKDTAVTSLKEFEMVNGVDPSQRGGPQYRSAYQEWLKSKTGSTHIQVNAPTGDQTDILARGILDGTIDPNGISKRGGLQQAVWTKVKQMSPTFNLVEAGGSAKFKTSSQTMQTKALLNTIDPLLDKLQQAGAILGNSSLPGYNRARNFLKEQTGAADIVGFNNLRDAVVAEVERGLLGTGVLTDNKYQRELKNLNSAQSFPQLKTAINNTKTVIRARLEAIHQGPNTAPSLSDQPSAPNKRTITLKSGKVIEVE